MRKREFPRKGCSSTFNYEQNTSMATHLPHHIHGSCNITEVEKILPEEKKDEYSHRGQGTISGVSHSLHYIYFHQAQWLSLHWTAALFSRRQQQHHQFGTEKSHVFCPCLSNLCCPITCKVPHKSQSTIRPHRDIIPRVLQGPTSWEGPENPEEFLKS